MAGLSYAIPYADGSPDRVVSSLFVHHLSRADKARTLLVTRVRFVLYDSEALAVHREVLEMLLDPPAA